MEPLKGFQCFFIYEIIDKSRGELATFLWRSFSSAKMHILLISSEVSERKLGSQIPFGGKWLPSPYPFTHETWMSNLINSAKVAKKETKRDPRTPSDNGKVLRARVGRKTKPKSGAVWEFCTLWRQINNMRTMCEKKIAEPRPDPRWNRHKDRLSESESEHFPWHLRAIWLISDSLPDSSRRRALA